jgi:GTP-binding protein HflX
MAAHSLEELRRLTETAGGSVVASIAQRMERFNPKSLIGSGKIVEVRKLVETLGAQTVIFDEDLTPAQQIHLEKEIKAKIVDRTRLILDIFAQRARTKEGELQVELAQLSYMLPRLTGSWRAFSQQAGGIGTRGPGERKLEYERRHIQRRLSHLKLGIERMGRDRGVQRRRRSLIPVPSVAIIGYTNAGKSSLLNRLTRISAPERKNASSRVYADDKLFATLDPTTRRIRLPDGGFAVFTDTVGFISKLPTALIAAFRSTLEEVAHADCLLHLEDGASDIISRQRRIVDDVLDSLQAKEIPRVFAVNKSDVLTRDSRISIKAYDDSRVLVSARTGDGVDDLLRQVQTILNDKWLLRKIELDPKDARFLKDIHQNAQVLKQSSHNGKITLLLRVTQENHARLLKKISP